MYYFPMTTTILGFEMLNDLERFFKIKFNACKISVRINSLLFVAIGAAIARNVAAVERCCSHVEEFRMNRLVFQIKT